MTQDVILRKQSMLDDLPVFYSDAPEVDGILQAEAVEVERVRANARLLLSQLTAVTATFGLTDWERVLDLPPRPNSPEQLRRARILAKLRGAAPATVANILSIINAHVPNKNASIVELPTDGTFEVVIPPQSGLSLTELHRDLNIYKPAHLEFTIAILAILVNIDIKFRAYEFEVNYPITNMFATADLAGVLTKFSVNSEQRVYSFKAENRITNQFTTEEYTAPVSIGITSTVRITAYDAPYTRLGEHTLGGGLRLGSYLGEANEYVDQEDILTRFLLQTKIEEVPVLYRRLNDSTRLGEVEI